MGSRLLSQVQNCTKEPYSELWNIYCVKENNTIAENVTECDPYFQAHSVSERPAILGIASHIFSCTSTAELLSLCSLNHLLLALIHLRIDGGNMLDLLLTALTFFFFFHL